MQTNQRCGDPALRHCLLNLLAQSGKRIPQTACELCGKTERDLDNELREAGKLFAVQPTELPDDEEQLRAAIEVSAIERGKRHREQLRHQDDYYDESNLSSSSRNPADQDQRNGDSSSRFPTLKRLGRGGLGQVFISRDREIPRDVAVRELLPEFADSATNQARFLREATITGMLEHPGVVPVYSVSRHRDGRPYYAMRIIHGESMRMAIKHLHRPTSQWFSREREMTLRGLLQRFIRICETVAYAHDHDVIHRNIKPENIMLGSHGETLLVDWSIAMFVTPEAREQATSSGDLPEGTVEFMSPEQATGDASLQTRQSDQFSLGATLYMILVGRPPYGNKDRNLLERVKSASIEIPKSAGVPRELQAVCLRALSRDPADRYESVRELADDVEYWLADEPVSAMSETRLDQVRRFARRHRVAMVVGIIGLLSTTFAAVVALIVVLSNRG